MGLIRSLAKKVLGRASTAQPAPSAPPPTPVPPGVGAPSTTDKPWYLDGQNDGWDTTDVEPSDIKKHE